MNTSWVARYVEGDGLWGISEPFWLVPLLPWIRASRFALLSIGRLALLLRPRPNLRPPPGEETGRASPAARIHSLNVRSLGIPLRRLAN